MTDCTKLNLLAAQYGGRAYPIPPTPTLAERELADMERLRLKLEKAEAQSHRGRGYRAEDGVRSRHTHKRCEHCGKNVRLSMCRHTCPALATSSA